MAFKLVLLAAIIAVSQAVVIPGAGIVAAPGYPAYGYPGIAKVAAPLGIAKAVAPVDEYDPNPQYSYSYDINDALTGDSKSQQESRSGDVVQGSYSLVEPDGTRRIVEYTADPVQGFNAVVHKEPLAAKAIVAGPAIAKVGVAAPLYGGYHAPALAHRLASPYGVPTLAYH